MGALDATLALVKAALPQLWEDAGLGFKTLDDEVISLDLQCVSMFRVFNKNFRSFWSSGSSVACMA